MIKNAESGSIEKFTSPKMLLKSKIRETEFPETRTFTAGIKHKNEAVKVNKDSIVTLNFSENSVAIKPLNKYIIIPVKKYVMINFHSK